MGRVKADEIPTEAAFMTDLWQAVKATFALEDTDDYWDYVVDLTNRLTAKYPGNLFAQEMTIGYLNYLDKAGKEKMKNDTL